MITLTMRVVKGDFIVTGPAGSRRAPRRAIGARRAIRLADHGGWLRSLHSSGWNNSARLTQAFARSRNTASKSLRGWKRSARPKRTSNQRRVALAADDRVRA